MVIRLILLAVTETKENTHVEKFPRQGNRQHARHGRRRRGLGLNPMRLALFKLTGPNLVTQRQADIVHDALWAHLGPSHGVEHITATATSTGIDLAVFVDHSIGHPSEYVGRLIDLISTLSPALGQWRR